MNPIKNTLVTMVGELTIIRSIPPQPHHEKFPMWTYRLTPIVSLPDPEDTLTRYTDVMGVIRGISSIATLTRPCRNFPASRRHILLDDGSGNEVRVTLWGESAYRFNEGVIRFLAEDQSAAIIFVGLTISMVQGSDACRWYINEDIEETNVLQTRLLPSFRLIGSLPLPWQITLRAAVGFTCPKDALSVLSENNFVQNQPKSYSCSNVGCECTGAVLEFCLHLLGSDGTREAEFTLFGRLAQDIIGASPRQIILNNVGAGADTTELAAAATTIMHTPSELTAILSWSYKFVIHVTSNSFQGNWERFNVCTVDEAYPPE